MKNNTLTILLALLVSLVFGGLVYGTALKSAPVQVASAASVDYFLKIEGIDGESTDSMHPGAIEVDSFSWGVSNMGTGGHGGGGGSGKASFQDIHFTSKVSKASPKLMLATATGEHIRQAVLFVRKAGTNQQDYYVVKFEDVLVSSYQSSGGGSSGDTPTDQFSLNFTKIEFEYKPQKADGTLDAPVKAGYDLKKGTK